MVCTRLPEHGFALHAVIAHEDILDGIIDRMAHMQTARHIGRRYDDGEIIVFGIAGFRCAGLKRTALFPHLIEAGFSFFGIELIVEHI